MKKPAPCTLEYTIRETSEHGETRYEVIDPDGDVATEYRTMAEATAERDSMTAELRADEDDEAKHEWLDQLRDAISDAVIDVNDPVKLEAILAMLKPKGRPNQ